MGTDVVKTSIVLTMYGKVRWFVSYLAFNFAEVYYYIIISIHVISHQMSRMLVFLTLIVK